MVPGEGIEPPTNGLQNRFAVPEFSSFRLSCQWVAISKPLLMFRFLVRPRPSIARSPRPQIAVTVRPRKHAASGSRFGDAFVAHVHREVGAVERVEYDRAVLSVRSEFIGVVGMVG